MTVSFSVQEIWAELPPTPHRRRQDPYHAFQPASHNFTFFVRPPNVHQQQQHQPHAIFDLRPCLSFTLSQKCSFSVSPNVAESQCSRSISLDLMNFDDRVCLFFGGIHDQCHRIVVDGVNDILASQDNESVDFNIMQENKKVRMVLQLVKSLSHDGRSIHVFLGLFDLVWFLAQQQKLELGFTS
ncbi:hypothetical protein ACSQ67_013742 [Phaseolus vulgaris]